MVNYRETIDNIFSILVITAVIVHLLQLGENLLSDVVLQLSLPRHLPCLQVSMPLRQKQQNLLICHKRKNDERARWLKMLGTIW